ncbi:MAG TPA: T9SS type A sorting domain-containing protein [Bacteroidales bacterium]|nr:T9SS type A sorting domain-containing protein [Bacteroidales bacterium]
MRYLSVLFILILQTLNLLGQFHPPAGQPGTSAIYKDSNVFVSWAKVCVVNRGYVDISNPALGYVTSGHDSCATGKAGEKGAVSLGDGGNAILYFDKPIINGPGYDFAVFENSFNDTFLELAFVEVSSDGINFFRFPATSNTPTNYQVGTFGSIDATKVNNLAGKYKAFYGTPFDLDELTGIPNLNVNNIVAVKIIDVVGCIQQPYATYDYFGNIINDPWPTPFASGGFDLDAVGIINQNDSYNVNEYDNNKIDFLVYPSILKKDNRHLNIIRLNNNLHKAYFTIFNSNGKIIYTSDINSDNLCIDLYYLSSGIYFLKILQDNNILNNFKIIIN